MDGRRQSNSEPEALRRQPAYEKRPFRRTTCRRVVKSGAVLLRALKTSEAPRLVAVALVSNWLPGGLRRGLPGGGTEPTRRPQPN
jgi:hypothetical protein